MPPQAGWFSSTKDQRGEKDYSEEEELAGSVERLRWREDFECPVQGLPAFCHEFYGEE